MKLRQRAAFTLVELLIAAGISSILGLIIYGVASEGVISFARNVSINRSYSNARQAMDRIGIAMQSAGHTPLLVDATGADTTATSAAGIRFWRCASSPLYYITTPALTASSLTLSLIKPGTTATVLPPPSAGDMIVVAAIGFQAQAVSVTASGTAATVTFSGTVATNTHPSQTASTFAKITGQMACLDLTSVAFIAVNNELRYYRKFISGTTSVSTAANYEVLTGLVPSVGTSTTAPVPFSLGKTPTINVDLYAEAPDYNNRNPPDTYNSFNGVSSANTYTFLQSALAPRTAALLSSPY